MRQVADITLIENTSAGNLHKAFSAQTVEIRQAADTTHLGVDGKISMAKHPSTVKWFGASATAFENITVIRIVTASGTILVDAEVLRNYVPPHNITNGVQFQILI